MAVMDKVKDTRLKVKKAKPKQLETVQTGELSDVSPNGTDRGIGSSYAMAVGNILEEAKMLRKGSQSGFLGKEKETIDVKEVAKNSNKR